MQIPPTKNIARWKMFKRFWQKPTIAMEAPHIPITAVKPLYTTVNGVALIINNSGANTKMYGTMNAAIASFAALTPVRMGFAPAIPAPANAANATGGVTSATIPK